MESSGFKVYKNFKTSQNLIDIYAVLPTAFGDFGVVVECNNYDKDFPVSIETLKHMETVGMNIKASKIVVISSSYFTEQAMNYALKKNIKLVDRSDLLALAKKYQDSNFKLDDDKSSNEEDNGEIIPIHESDVENYEYDNYDYDEDYEYDDYDYDYDTYMLTQRQRNPMMYQSSLYKRQYEFDENTGTGTVSFIMNKISGIIGFNEDRLDKDSSSYTSYSHSSLYKQSPSKPQESSHSLISTNIINIHIDNERDVYQRFKPYLGNPVFLVFLVVVVTWFLSFLGGLLKADHLLISSIQIIVSLILSYGFSYYYSDRSMLFIVRGTIIFFISLIVLIILLLI